MPKRSIRSQFLAERKSTPAAVCANLSLAIQRRLLSSRLFGECFCLALYCAVHNEVQTNLVALQALQSGKTLAYPRVNSETLEFVAVASLDALKPGAFGILEPCGDSLVPLDRLDLIVVPGVAFDRLGHRLGYGRGFYDRALSSCRPGCAKLGFAFSSQVVETLPTASHDVKLSVLMTEDETLKFTD